MPGASIAVFAYRRPAHLRRMLESLLRNPEAMRSLIRIYCDDARGPGDRDDVAATRQAARALAPPHAQIVEREHNLGLARSVITGVTELCAEAGAVIVLEDDLVLSPYALNFLNRALERYRNEPRVMHVSAYMYPVQASLPEAFFCREATCWGWATWSRAWAHFEPDAHRLVEALQARGDRAAFDSDNSFDFFRLLEMQARGEVDSWAIRWYATLWLHDGLALHPDRALAANTGHDGTGEHSQLTHEYDVDLRAAPVIALPDEIRPSREAMHAIARYRRSSRPGLWQRIRRRILG